jgi:hypothetical protein
MPIIEVLVNTVVYEEILNCYNNNKKEGQAELKKLNRADGGFQIDLPEHEWKKNYIGYVDANDKIKQLRWINGKLLSYISHPQFSLEEYMLLYEVLVKVLPPGSVLLHS